MISITLFFSFYSMLSSDQSQYTNLDYFLKFFYYKHLQVVRGRKRCLAWEAVEIEIINSCVLPPRTSAIVAINYRSHSAQRCTPSKTS